MTRIIIDIVLRLCTYIHVFYCNVYILYGNRMYLVPLFQEALHPFHLDIVLILYRNGEGVELLVCLFIFKNRNFISVKQQGHCLKINILVVTSELYLTVDTIASVLEVYVPACIKNVGGMYVLNIYSLANVLHGSVCMYI